jgi:hypothetical protein
MTMKSNKTYNAATRSQQRAGYAFPSAKESDDQLQRMIDADIAARKENPHWREMTEVEETAMRAGWAACFLWIERHAAEVAEGANPSL